jgi:hypothetical protein
MSEYNTGDEDVEKRHLQGGEECLYDSVTKIRNTYRGHGSELKARTRAKTKCGTLSTPSRDETARLRSR